MFIAFICNKSTDKIHHEEIPEVNDINRIFNQFVLCVDSIENHIKNNPDNWEIFSSFIHDEDQKEIN